MDFSTQHLCYCYCSPSDSFQDPFWCCRAFYCGPGVFLIEAAVCGTKFRPSLCTKWYKWPQVRGIVGTVCRQEQNQKRRPDDKTLHRKQGCCKQKEQPDHPVGKSQLITRSCIHPDGCNRHIQDDLVDKQSGLNGDIADQDGAINPIADASGVGV